LLEDCFECSADRHCVYLHEVMRGFVALQAAFNISNDNDAEVSLQIANAATQALLSYRMKMIPVLVGLHLLHWATSLFNSTFAEPIC